MAKSIKTRKGEDGFHYPYTSPDLVIDKNGKSTTTKFNELETKIETGSGTSIDDVNTSTDKTWSSSKIDARFKEIAETGTTIETVQNKVQERSEKGLIQAYTLGDGTVDKTEIC